SLKRRICSKRFLTSRLTIAALTAPRTASSGLGCPLLDPAFQIQFPQVLRADRRQLRNLIPDPLACLFIVFLRQNGAVVPVTCNRGRLAAPAILTVRGEC